MSKKNVLLIDDVTHAIIGFFDTEKQALADAERRSALDLRYRSVWVQNARVSATANVHVKRSD